MAGFKNLHKMGSERKNSSLESQNIYCLTSKILFGINVF